MTIFGTCRIWAAGTTVGHRVTSQKGTIASYQTEPFSEDRVITGPGLLELHINSPVEEVTVQATFTEVRPDGNETLIQSGWLNLKSPRLRTVNGLDLVSLCYREGWRLRVSIMPIRWMGKGIDNEHFIPSVAHAIREGSTLRVAITTPKGTTAHDMLINIDPIYLMTTHPHLSWEGHYEHHIPFNGDCLWEPYRDLPTL